MTPAGESADTGDSHEAEVVDCDLGGETSEVSPVFLTATLVSQW